MGGVRALLLPVLLAGVAASAAPGRLSDAQAKAQTGASLGRAAVAVDGGRWRQVTGTLRAEYCVEADQVCVPPGASVTFLVDEHGATLQAVTSPKPFSGWGLRFAAGREVRTGAQPGALARGPLTGTVTDVLERDAARVTGDVVVDVADGGVDAVRIGTLAAPLTHHGWKLPAGTWVDLATPGIRFEVRDAKAPAAERVGPPDHFPKTARQGYVTGEDAARFMLDTPYGVADGLTFAPGALTLSTRPGGARRYSGVLAAPLAIGGLRAKPGAAVTWEADAGVIGASIDFEGLGTPFVEVVRGADGGMTGFTFEVEPQCGCGGFPRPPRRVRLSLDGKPLDGISEQVLAERPRACPPCRGKVP